MGAGTDARRSAVGAWDEAVHPAVAVVEAVADHEGVDVDDLPPLYDHVDPAVLENLRDAADGSVGTVTFRYCGYEVRFGSDGAIVLGG